MDGGIGRLGPNQLGEGAGGEQGGGDARVWPLVVLPIGRLLITT
jgi:hypothetical protein